MSAIAEFSRSVGTLKHRFREVPVPQVDDVTVQLLKLYRFSQINPVVLSRTKETLVCHFYALSIPSASTGALSFTEIPV